MVNLNTIQYWIDSLQLLKHPEGGYYREIYRSPVQLDGTDILKKYGGRRNSATSIYFLLNSTDVSHFHRLRSDEIWYYHAGSPVMIYMIDIRGELTTLKLGINLALGEMPQVLVPEGTIFGATVNEENSFSLVSCMVTPGFHFQDFELLSQARLLAKYPQHEEIIRKLGMK